MRYLLVSKAGYNPADYFKNNPHRFKSLHIKDMNHDGDSCIVGNGTIDFPKLLISPGLTGNELIIYEQEHYSEGGAALLCTTKYSIYSITFFLTKTMNYGKEQKEEKRP